MKRMVRPRRRGESGLALIVILGVLAILAALATSFAFNMRLEQAAARNQAWGVMAKMVEQGALEYLIAVVADEATDMYDTPEDDWGHRAGGPDARFSYYSSGTQSAIDADGSSAPSEDYRPTFGRATGADASNGLDALWIQVTIDPADGIYGRYALLALDTGALVCVNTAGNLGLGAGPPYHNSPDNTSEGWAPFEISIAKLLEAIDDVNGSVSWTTNDEENYAKAIVDYRYGPGAASPAPEQMSPDLIVTGPNFSNRESVRCFIKPSEPPLR